MSKTQMIALVVSRRDTLKEEVLELCTKIDKERTKQRRVMLEETLSHTTYWLTYNDKIVRSIVA